MLLMYVARKNDIKSMIQVKKSKRIHFARFSSFKCFPSRNYRDVTIVNEEQQN